MDFRQLQTFVEVVNSGSFSKAAEKLFITQPTVSNHIQLLEKQVDADLINRNGRSFELTDAGEILYKHALKIMELYERAEFEIESFNKGVSGILRIYASSIPRDYILPEKIKEFIMKYPDVEFHLQGGDSKTVCNSILDGDSDFGIIGTKYNHKSLSYIKILEDEMVLIAPNDLFNDKNNGESISFKDIKDLPFIFREEGSGSRNEAITAIADAGYDLDGIKIRANCEDNTGIKELVSNGIGVSLISDLAIKNEIALKKFKYFKVSDLTLKRDFYLVYHRVRSLQPLGELFKKFLLK